MKMKEVLVMLALLLAAVATVATKSEETEGQNLVRLLDVLVDVEGGVASRAISPRGRGCFVPGCIDQCTQYGYVNGVCSWGTCYCVY